VFREKFPKSSFKQRIFQVRGAEPVNCMFGKLCMIVMILCHEFSCPLCGELGVWVFGCYFIGILPNYMNRRGILYLRGCCCASLGFWVSNVYKECCSDGAM